MSTKAIREVLERSKRMWRDSDSVREIQAAFAEVEAIEAAALEFYENGRDAHYDVAFNLMDAIAKQND